MILPPPTATRNISVIIALQLIIYSTSHFTVRHFFTIYLAPKEFNLFRESTKCLEQKWKVWKLAESNEVLDWNKIPLARI
jgi:predicted proteasome-type protease